MADSPFLPGTSIQYAWDSTSLGWLKECPRKYQYHMIEGWVGKGESVHLRFGIWYHSALELYDRLCINGATHEDSLLDVVLWLLKETWIDGKPWTSDHASKTRENLVRSVVWYVEHFKDDPAKTVVLANGKPAVELSFRMELNWGPGYKAGSDGKIENVYLDEPRQPYMLSGHLDRLVTFADGTYVMDRKTSSSTLGNYYFDQYDPDNQMTLYSLAAKVIYQTPVKGVIIDAVQVAVGFSQFKRGFTYRTDGQMEEWLGDLRSWFIQAEGYATAGYWPMNDKSCHKYGGCVFRKICSKDPSVREKFLETDFVRRHWNPLEAR